MNELDKQVDRPIGAFAAAESGRTTVPRFPSDGSPSSPTSPAPAPTPPRCRCRPAPSNDPRALDPAYIAFVTLRYKIRHGTRLLSAVHSRTARPHRHHRRCASRSGSAVDHPHQWPTDRTSTGRRCQLVKPLADRGLRWGMRTWPPVSGRHPGGRLLPLHRPVRAPTRSPLLGSARNRRSDWRGHSIDRAAIRHAAGRTQTCHNGELIVAAQLAMTRRAVEH